MSISKRSAGAVTAALVSTLCALPEAHAANRAYPGTNAQPIYAADAGCLSRSLGIIRNNCNFDVRVQLPMSVDAAAWYYVSVYGRRTGTANVSCAPTVVKATGTVQFGAERNFVFADGRAEVMKLPAMPIYSPGEALFVECEMGPGTSLFSYGWN